MELVCERCGNDPERSLMVTGSCWCDRRTSAACTRAEFERRKEGAMSENPKLFVSENYTPHEAIPTVVASTEITLRDMFAAAALISLAITDTQAVGENIERHATWSYEVADAMLTARSKQ